MPNALSPLLGCALMVIAVVTIVAMAGRRPHREPTDRELGALRAEARDLRRGAGRPGPTEDVR